MALAAGFHIHGVLNHSPSLRLGPLWPQRNYNFRVSSSKSTSPSFPFPFLCLNPHPPRIKRPPLRASLLRSCREEGPGGLTRQNIHPTDCEQDGCMSKSPPSSASETPGLRLLSLARMLPFLFAYQVMYTKPSHTAKFSFTQETVPDCPNSQILQPHALFATLHH